MELFKERYSCRNYLDKEVEKEKLEQIINAALLAPSACNKQPWRYFVVTSKEILEQLKLQCFGGMINNFVQKVPVLIAVGIKKDIVTHTIAGGLIKNIPYHYIDVGISTDHLMLKATDIGLATCWIGWFNKKNAEKILNTTKGVSLCGFIALGYSADEKVPEKKRESIDKVVRWV
jgi:nitroreductase